MGNRSLLRRSKLKKWNRSKLLHRHPTGAQKESLPVVTGPQKESHLPREEHSQWLMPHQHKSMIGPLHLLHLLTPLPVANGRPAVTIGAALLTAPVGNQPIRELLPSNHSCFSSLPSKKYKNMKKKNFKKEKKKKKKKKK